MLTAIYEQATGLLLLDLGRGITQRYVGYSGHGIGRNNPRLDWAKQSGPIPKGLWTLGRAQAHPRLGPVAIPLWPAPGTDTHGRSGFFIHGDNARNDASQGCIILPRQARDRLVALGIHTLSVVECLPKSAMEAKRAA